MAEVLHFYGGLGWGELLDMEFIWFCKLVANIPVVEARRHLAALPLMAYPHVDGDARGRIQEALMRASGAERQRQEALAADQYEAGWALLRGFGTPGNGGREG
jgi:hypothetical protein